MFGLDEQIATLAHGGGLVLVLLVGILLGLRHATDPDHLTAVSTLVLADERLGARRASVLGISWGLGHATTLLAFGLPIVLFGRYLPDAWQRAAEMAVGLIIMALAVRLLVRWRRGYLHAHPHAHGGLRHAHPHVHEHRHAEQPTIAHRHHHGEDLARSPRTAFAIGLVHGMGGSAGVGVLLLSAISDRAYAVAALIVLTGATAVSMAAVSLAFGRALGGTASERRLETVTPVLGVVSLLFGVWYTLGAAGAVAYVF